MTISIQNQKIKDIFLSHSSADNDFVSKLAVDIEANKFEGRNLLTWVDEAEIKGGESIPGKVNFGLEDSRFFGIVMTPDYFNSQSGWTDAEWHSALHLDPDNRDGRIISLLAKDCPYIPILLRQFRMIDLRGKLYNRGVRELLAILQNEPLHRPLIYKGQLISSNGRIDRQTYLAERSAVEGDPDITEENLSCNLLPIIGLPHFLYTASISNKYCKLNKNGKKSLPSKQKLKNIIKEDQLQKKIEKPYTPIFRMYKDGIVTFHDLENTEGPLKIIIDENNIEIAPVKEWIQDGERRKILISLLNMSISRYAIRKGLVADNTKGKSSRFYFPVVENGKPNIIEWKPTNKRAQRTVSKPCIDNNGTVLFWRHQAAYLKILFLANKFYMQIIPTIALTDDGSKIKTGSKTTSKVNKWLGRERNLQILYHIRFWSVFLKGKAGPISILTGDQRLEISPTPAYVKETFGVLNDQFNLMDKLNEEAELIDEEIEDTIDEELEKELNEEDEIEPEEDEVLEIIEETDEYKEKEYD